MIELRRPHIDLVPSYLACIDEMVGQGETVWPDWVPTESESPQEFVERLLRAETVSAPEWVTQSVFWAVADDVVVGRIVLRHQLTESLAAYGGHISYEVRPSFRRKGVGTQMLGRLLRQPRARAIGRLVVTCAPDNIGSNRTIAANGGVLSHTGKAPQSGRPTNVYWIDARVLPDVRR